MSGLTHPIASISATGDDRIDGILSTGAWAETTIYYSFAANTSIYHYTTNTDLPAGFATISALQQDAIRVILDASAGTSANNGFSGHSS